MSHSEDEDDFLSADEYVECEQENRCDIRAKNQQASIRVSKFNESKNTKVIQDTSVAEEIESIPEIKLKFEEEVLSTNPATRHRIHETQLIEEGPGRQKNGETVSDNDESEASIEEHEDDDEEAALAELTRERNLKIARNFSVEIVKNLQASAPIPVEMSASSPRRKRYSDNNTELNVSRNPPAPPPTPALSSSFSNQEEQFTKNASSGSPSLSNQYSWRLSSRTASSIISDTPLIDTLKSTNGEKENPSFVESNVKSSEQARMALDRLSQKLSQPDKNLFERVASDIRNMSITGDDSIIPADVTSQLTALPSTITDLGSTLGGWGWSGATKLLSSATQVTSQVGSVLNSIVDVSQPQSTMLSTSDFGEKQDLAGSTKGVKKD